MNAVELAHQHVLAALLDGDLRPGQWIRQDDLAAELGISKVPVREALQRFPTPVQEQALERLRRGQGRSIGRAIIPGR